MSLHHTRRIVSAPHLNLPRCLTPRLCDVELASPVSIDLKPAKPYCKIEREVECGGGG